MVEAGSHGVREAFLESYPQLVTQSLIICSTGTISIPQAISLPVSLLSLAMAASKSFFTMRSGDDKEADPTLTLMISTILPWTIVSVLSSLYSWLMICGLMGEFAIPAFLLNLCISVCVLKKIVGTRRSQQDQELELSCPPVELKDEDNTEPFTLLSACTGLSVPCIVGSKEKTLLATGITNNIIRTFITGIVFLTANFWIKVRGGKAILAWCIPIDETVKYHNRKFCHLLNWWLLLAHR